MKMKMRRGEGGGGDGVQEGEIWLGWTGVEWTGLDSIELN